MARRGCPQAVLPFLLLGAVMCLATGPAAAVVITFEDLNPNDPNPPGVHQVLTLPGGYSGFDWDLDGGSGLYFLSDGGAASGGWFNSPPFGSGSYAAAFGYDGTLSLTRTSSGGTFGVNSLWVGWGGYQGGPGSDHKMTITGYSGGSVVNSIVVEPLQVRYVSGPLLLSGFVGLDRFTLSGGPEYLVDDIDISAVPEPSLGLLLLLGVVPVAIARRMRKRNSAAV